MYALLMRILSRFTEQEVTERNSKYLCYIVYLKSVLVTYVFASKICERLQSGCLSISFTLNYHLALDALRMSKSFRSYSVYIYRFTRLNARKMVKRE